MRLELVETQRYAVLSQRATRQRWFGRSVAAFTRFSSRVDYGDPALRAQWTAECKAMADRIIEMRQLLVDNLAAAGSTKDWSHITSQIGMFAYSGMSKEQVESLRYDHAIYMTGKILTEI